MEILTAICQRPPVLLDKKASMAAAVAMVAEAAGQGARLMTFPEAFLPGYPEWVWRLRPGADRALGNEIHRQLQLNAINIGSGDLDPLWEAAARHGMVIVMGMHELDAEFSGSTLFNTVVVIGDDGTVLNKHRKLMPTNPERMVWGEGDASGLRVVETKFGRLGCLICWENYMPLARYALYAQSMDILVAITWDCGDLWIASMRHIAKEGGCWVLSSTTALQGSDIPLSFPGRDQLFKDEEWINPGDAIAVKPGGALVAGPMHEEKSILYVMVDADLARASRKSFDPTGHYARSDVFQLKVDRRQKAPAVFQDSD